MQKELFPGAAVKIEDTDDIATDEKKLSAINTPKAKKSLLNGPRTPTPFKNALDEFRKIRGGESYVPSSPNRLVEDITEIMKKEQQQDSTIDSVYETDCSVTAGNAQTDTEQASSSNPKRLSFDGVDNGNQQTNKKAKKSLEPTWNSSAANAPKDLPYIVETPVRFYRHMFSFCAAEFV